MDIQQPIVSAMGAGVDLDLTLVPSIAIFLVLLFLLNQLLFKPYLEILEKRAAMTEGAMDKAEALQAEAAVLREKYDAALLSAREEARAKRETLREEAKAEEQSLLSAAREQAESFLSAERSKLDAEMNKAGTEIETRAQDLSGVIAQRLVVNA